MKSKKNDWIVPLYANIYKLQMLPTELLYWKEGAES